MPTLLAFPILGIVVLLQTTVLGRLPLLHGTADLMLIVLVAWALQERVTVSWQWTLIGGAMITLVSAMPLLALFASYLMVTGVARLLQQRVWQTPILAMFFTTFVGTILQHLISIVVLQFNGTPLPLGDSLSLVTLPSALLNLILALPVYAVISDLAQWVYPAEVEI